ncbi:MAG TPA: hypothetical protein VGM69_17725 [Chloroflexota bacterium]|jgi:uncharacterized membrane protein YphA (DoxX/SURF4 family)
MSARSAALRPAAAAAAAGPVWRGTDLARSAPLYWVLRVACAFEFVGHGAFGLMTKAAWVPYFGVVGIPPELAWTLMPLIGTVDISVGLIVALRPMRALLLYMAFWGFLTATIRPLAGEPVWEFLERAPNWAVPLAFLCLSGFGRSAKEWLSIASRGALTRTLSLWEREREGAGSRRLDWLLRIATAGALVGHGAFGAVMAKPAWFGYFAAAGLPPSAGLVSGVGLFEIALGLLVLVRPIPALLLFVVLWKLGTELLRPLAGEPLWEFVERWSSYTAPLALLWVRGWPATAGEWLSGSGRGRPAGARAGRILAP